MIKTKCIAAICVLMFSPFGYAEWNVVKKIDDIDTHNQVEIMLHLSGFQTLLNNLTAWEFTDSSKFVVDHFEAKVNLMRWENDSECQVADPHSIPTQTISSSGAWFYYKDDPDSRGAVIVGQNLLMPCDPGLKPGDGFLKTTIKRS